MPMQRHDRELVEAYLRDVGVTRCPTVPCDLPLWGLGFPPILIVISPNEWRDGLWGEDQDEREPGPAED
jgi:hypothetical protein